MDYVQEQIKPMFEQWQSSSIMELEARFFFLSPTLEQIGISEKQLEAIATYLESLSGYEVTTSDTIDYCYGEYRYTEEQGVLKEVLCKVPFAKKDFLLKNYNVGFRVNAKTEQKVSEFPPLEKDKASSVRKKKRKSYKKDHFSIDITHVTDMKNQKTVELEIEVCKSTLVTVGTFCAKIMDMVSLLLALQ